MPAATTANFGQTLRKSFDGFLDLIYPPRCLICGRDGEPAICDFCFDQFAPIPDPICDACGRPIDSPTCRFCATHESLSNGVSWAFAGARAASVYDGPLRHAIHQLKYRYVEALGEPLGAHLANRAVADGLIPSDRWKTIDAIVPMPIPAARRRRRGYNQTELLARPLATMQGLPLLTDVLRRTGPATAQVGLSLETRRANVSDASFAIVDLPHIAGKTLLLVDDVFTTGTSVDACARALRAPGGAAAVYVLALAAGD